MPEPSEFFAWLVSCSVNVATLAAAPPLLAGEDEAAESIEEIIVVGTRRQDRTVTTSPVPVDVFYGDELRNIGSRDIDDILRTLIPSYDVERYPLHDASSLVRPARVRGLPPGNTLILAVSDTIAARYWPALQVGRKALTWLPFPQWPSNAWRCCATAPPRSTAPTPSQVSSTSSPATATRG